MNLAYSFKHINIGEGTTVKEPIMPVTLLGAGGIKLNVTAILDTGSDFILLPLELAEALGLEFDSSKKDSAKSYAGEPMATTESRVRIKIERGR